MLGTIALLAVIALAAGYFFGPPHLFRDPINAMIAYARPYAVRAWVAVTSFFKKKS